MDATLTAIDAALEDVQIAVALVGWQRDDDGDLTLALRMVEYGDDAPARTLQLRCRRPVWWRVDDGEVDRVVLSTDHDALRLVAEPRATVVFLGRPAEPEALASRLLRRLDARTGGLLSARACFNTGTGIAELLARGRGALATGPITLMRELGDVLAENDVAGSVVELPSRGRGADELRVLDLGCALVVADDVVVVH